MRYGGWYLIAYERDLAGGLCGTVVSTSRLLCARTSRGIEVFDAVCPHRGANLGIGGVLDGDYVVCPYHAYRISLGEEDGGPFCVRRHPSIAIGGLIFALLGGCDEGELPGFLAELGRTCQFVPGFEKRIRIAPEMVIENAFDARHFGPVHDVKQVTTMPAAVERGVFTAATTLRVGASAWQGGDDTGAYIDVPLFARAFSPNLTITQIAMGGYNPHFVIAGACPQPDGSALIRLSIAMPYGPGGEPPDPDTSRTILEFESFGLEQDRPVWENLAHDIEPRWTGDDATVLAFRKWCERFLVEGAR